MAKYRKIAPSIWNDAKFRRLSDNAKLVFFMLLTHPQTSAIGTLRAYPQGLAPEMKWSEKGFREAFSELVGNGMVICSETDGLIWLPNFTKYNQPDNPNVLKSWAGALEDCPECELKVVVFQHIKRLAETLGGGFLKGFMEGFPDTFGNGMPKQEQEQEQEQEYTVSNETVVGSEQPTSPPNCPHEKILAVYHETLPELPAMKTWGSTRRTDLQARWIERWKAGKYQTQAEGLDYWRRLFIHVQTNCDFLMGRKTDFRASLDWMVKYQNFSKLIEGRYDNRGGQA